MRPKIRLVGDSDNPLYGMQSERGAWETQGTVSKDEPLCILEEPNRFFKFVYILPVEEGGIKKTEETSLCNEMEAEVGAIQKQCRLERFQVKSIYKAIALF